MEPAWHAASEALAAAGSNVVLAKIDASDPTNQSVGSLYGVRGYPTMKTFKDSNAGDYTGPRDTEGIISWVNSNMN
jgi:protein disulfide-isomerase A1